MAPGTWNAPGENYTVATAGGGVEYCSRLQTAPTCAKGIDATDLPAVRTSEQGE